VNKISWFSGEERKNEEKPATANNRNMSMELLRSQDFKDILQVMTILSSSLDKDDFRQKLLDSFLRIFHMENSIFFLTDQNSNLTDLMGKNIDEKYTRDFVDYYHQDDPFRLIQGRFHGNRIISLQNLVSYPSFLNTEYYNDFLRPQKIYYKTVIYLKSGTDLLGIIGLFRPKGFGNFSEKDIRIMNILTPYLRQALKNIDAFRRIQLENCVFKMADQDSFSGLIILNDSMETVYMNKWAKDFCKNLAKPPNGDRKPRNGEDSYPSIPYLLTEDCNHLREQMKHNSFSITPLPISRILKLSGYGKYSLCSQILSKEMSMGGQVFYMVKIDELTRQVTLNTGALERDFGLTKREIDILVNIFNGLKNAEIAERLFISEITVKEHLQHIFEKIDVSSRTALIRKTVEYQYTKPQA
jgi:DNA-binding CsgD family transcriptional regulator